MFGVTIICSINFCSVHSSVQISHGGEPGPACRQDPGTSSPKQGYQSLMLSITCAFTPVTCLQRNWHTVYDCVCDKYTWFWFLFHFHSNIYLKLTLAKISLYCISYWSSYPPTQVYLSDCFIQDYVICSLKSLFQFLPSLCLFEFDILPHIHNVHTKLLNNEITVQRQRWITHTYSSWKKQ